MKMKYDAPEVTVVSFDVAEELLGEPGGQPGVSEVPDE